jgi:spermidine synthase
MSRLFEELDYRDTPIGPISLRRRFHLTMKVDVYEIILGEEHLMSSLFNVSEVALARLGLEKIDSLKNETEERWDIVVGGLGLGYTAAAVLESPQVGSLLVVELLDAVADWHEAGLVPLDPPLSADPRCRVLTDDFFALAQSDQGFDHTAPGRQYHAILIDIDHTPDWLLDARSGHFYSEDGLKQLRQHLKPGGVMGLWSDFEPDDKFLRRLSEVFAEAWAEPVKFHNPLQNNDYTQTIYLARTGS